MEHTSITKVGIEITRCPKLKWPHLDFQVVLEQISIIKVGVEHTLMPKEVMNHTSITKCWNGPQIESQKLE